MSTTYKCTPSLIRNYDKVTLSNYDSSIKTGLHNSVGRQRHAFGQRELERRFGRKYRAHSYSEKSPGKAQPRSRSRYRFSWSDESYSDSIYLKNTEKRTLVSFKRRNHNKRFFNTEKKQHEQVILSAEDVWVFIPPSSSKSYFKFGPTDEDHHLESSGTFLDETNVSKTSTDSFLASHTCENESIKGVHVITFPNALIGTQETNDTLHRVEDDKILFKKSTKKLGHETSLRAKMFRRERSTLSITPVGQSFSDDEESCTNGKYIISWSMSLPQVYTGKQQEKNKFGLLQQNTNTNSGITLTDGRRSPNMTIMYQTDFHSSTSSPPSSKSSLSVSDETTDDTGKSCFYRNPNETRRHKTVTAEINTVGKELAKKLKSEHKYKSFNTPLLWEKMSSEYEPNEIAIDTDRNSRASSEIIYNRNHLKSDLHNRPSNGISHSCNCKNNSSYVSHNKGNSESSSKRYRSMGDRSGMVRFSSQRGMNVRTSSSEEDSRHRHRQPSRGSDQKEKNKSPASPTRTRSNEKQIAFSNGKSRSGKTESRSKSPASTGAKNRRNAAGTVAKNRKSPSGIGSPTSRSPSGTAIPHRKSPSGTSVPNSRSPSSTAVPYYGSPSGTGVPNSRSHSNTAVQYRRSPSATGVSNRRSPSGTGVSKRKSPPGTRVSNRKSPSGTSVSYRRSPSGTGVANRRSPGTGMSNRRSPSGTRVSSRKSPSGTRVSNRRSPSGRGAKKNASTSPKRKGESPKGDKRKETAGKTKLKESVLDGIVPLTPAQICERCNKYRIDQEIGDCIPLDFSHVQQLEKLTENATEDSTRQLLKIVTAIIEEKVCKQMFRCLMPCSCPACIDRPKICKSLEQFLGGGKKKSGAKGKSGVKGGKNKSPNTSKQKGAGDSPKRRKRKGSGKAKGEKKDESDSGGNASGDSCAMRSVMCCHRPPPVCHYEKDCCGRYEPVTRWNSSWRNCSMRMGWWPGSTARCCTPFDRSWSNRNIEHQGQDDLFSNDQNNDAWTRESATDPVQSSDRDRIWEKNNNRRAFTYTGTYLTSHDDNWATPVRFLGNRDSQFKGSWVPQNGKTISDLIHRYGTDSMTPCPHDGASLGTSFYRNLANPTFQSDTSQCHYQPKRATSSEKPRWRINLTYGDEESSIPFGQELGLESNSKNMNGSQEKDRVSQSTKSQGRFSPKKSKGKECVPQSRNPSPTTTAIGELEARTTALLTETKFGQCQDDKQCDSKSLKNDLADSSSFLTGFSPIRPPDVNAAYSINCSGKMKKTAVDESKNAECSQQRGFSDKQWWDGLPQKTTKSFNSLFLKKYNANSAMPVSIEPISQDTLSKVHVSRSNGNPKPQGSRQPTTPIQERSRSEARISYTERKAFNKGKQNLDVKSQPHTAHKTASYTVCKGRQGKQNAKAKPIKKLWKY
ncbi:marker of proliferation ki-67 [Plakobranchus ocellatus]|uniref:Marker of proliferation ki-67 n=1 Tax=Plakobranchus ocellatus TaxID=259542 RepID=A0AAV3ZD44_9GAST|nr:marker of proliferation ki-67 [Plakobranchus ocellatus]